MLIGTKVAHYGTTYLDDPCAAAFNDGARKAEEATEAKMGKLTGGMPGLPGGMKLPF